MPAPHHSVFYRPDALLLPNQRRQSTEDKCTEQCSAVAVEIEVYYWHCPHSMRSRVYETVNVCPSVSLSHSSTTAACAGFAAVGWPGRWELYRSIAACLVPQQHRAAAQCTAAMQVVPRLQLM